MDIAHVDFDAVVAFLSAQFRNAPPEGPIEGRTRMRDAVAKHLGCSQLQAEEVVDTLVLRGRAALVRRADGPEVWQIG